MLPLLLVGYLGMKFRKWRISKNDAMPAEKNSHKKLWLIGLAAFILLFAIIAIANYLGNSQKTGEAGKPVIPKIDMHEHFRAGGDARYFLVAMAAAGIKKMVIVPTDWPPSNPKYKENLTAALEVKNKYPDKFIVFATAWNKDPDAAKIIEDAVKNGAGGMKFIDWLSSKKYPNEAGPVDSDNMYKVYEVAREYKVPVLMHIDFQKKPEWKAQFEKVAADFPDVTFILAHYCRAASGKTPQLSLCAQTLDKFPNVYTDISMGGGLNRYRGYFDKSEASAKKFRDFIIKYQDRILWGADIVLDGKIRDGVEKNPAWIFKRMATDFFILEHGKYLNLLHPEDKIIHRSLDLPDEVLQKIYWENPKKVLGI
ncbi:MAG: hypothetical protein UX07_C0023G0006 [Parcubacteria group bacterium GW2011_GWA2_45_30]|nr:MAG: hypothetical protein UX07_C0023G0006 [Parcubacteria group bacterium GW2011_GWA2_45_30]